MKSYHLLSLLIGLFGLSNFYPEVLFTQKKVSQPPNIFAKNIISTADDELGITFSPDGKTCFFAKRTASTIISNVYVICYSHWINGQWTEPQIAPFSGKYKDFNPFMTADGSKLFFISNRPGINKTKLDADIWFVKKQGDSWSEPENIGSPINSGGWELGCSITNDGTIYFNSTGSLGNLDIYRSKLVEGKYQQPEKLGESINTDLGESDPFIAPDESYLLFSSQGRSDALIGVGASASYPRSDLYISFNKNGKWTPAKNLGSLVNSEAEETNPSVSPDGKTLYFTSERNFVVIPLKKKLDYSTLESQLHSTGNGLGDIYQLPFSSILKDLAK